MTQEHVDELVARIDMQQPVLPLPLKPQQQSQVGEQSAEGGSQGDGASAADAAAAEPTAAARATAALAELWRRVQAFRRWDVEGKGVLDYHDVDAAIHRNFSREMVAIILGKDNLQDKFDAMDLRKEVCCP
jgi:hypothetical protein